MLNVFAFSHSQKMSCLLRINLKLQSRYSFLTFNLTFVLLALLQVYFFYYFFLISQNLSSLTFAPSSFEYKFWLTKNRNNEEKKWACNKSRVLVDFQIFCEKSVLRITINTHPRFWSYMHVLYCYYRMLFLVKLQLIFIDHWFWVV